MIETKQIFRMLLFVYHEFIISEIRISIYLDI